MLHREMEWDSGFIIPGLYVGSLRAATDAENLCRHGISHVLTAAGRLQVTVPDGIEHMQLDIADHPAENLFRVLDGALEFLDQILLQLDKAESGTRRKTAHAVLVHCASGISRSVSICCAWLMTRKGMSFAESIEVVRTNRPRADPNAGFKVQLAILEEAGGDVNAARELFADRIGDNDVMNMIRIQRETANELHAIAEELENEIRASHEDQITEETLSRWLSKLGDVQNRLDECAQELVWNDKPAVMIRKSAAQKTAMLLEQLGR